MEKEHKDSGASLLPGPAVSSVEEEELEAVAPAAKMEKHFTAGEMARYSSGICGYRIVRLSIELVLVIRVQELGFRVSTAGTIFLLYAMANILAGLFFIWFPGIFFGSMFRAMTYFVISVTCMCGGFLLMFIVEHFGALVFVAMICGIGTASWNINYQTITNLAFSREQVGSISRMRQLFESIGFLLPSICLAVVNSSTTTTGGDDENGSQEQKSVARASATILAIIGLLFHLLSADQVILAAANIRGNSNRAGEQQIAAEEQQSIWAALKIFFGTSIVLYFLLNSILLAASNILMGTMSLITENYFGLDPALLWIAAIAFPIGGMISVGLRMFAPVVHKSSKSVVLSGVTRMVLVIGLCIGLSPLAPPSNHRTAKALLFFFGLVTGLVYAVTFAASLELWLLKLKDFQPSFVTRATVINNLGVQAIMAVIFQLQTLLVDALVEDDSSMVAEASVYFAPLGFLFLVCWVIACRVPYAKDPKYGWPFPFPFSPFMTRMLQTLNFLGLGSVVDSSAFAYFYNFRVSPFSAHLKNSNVQKGPPVPKNAKLHPHDLEKHLMEFDKLDTQEEWWVSDSKLCSILLDNEDSFEKRIELVQNASSNIWIITWLFEHCSTGERFADELIKRSQEGVDVKVIVDAVTVRYLEEKYKLRGVDDMKTMKKLVEGGVAVRMLDALHEDQEPPYVIGSHRKIMIVDDRWVITGGRNTSNKYFGSVGFHYHDADVQLVGDFRSSTCVLYKDLWKKARDVNAVLKTDGPKPEKTGGPTVEMRSSTRQSLASVERKKSVLLVPSDSVSLTVSLRNLFVDESDSCSSEEMVAEVGVINESEKWEELDDIVPRISEIRVRRTSFFRSSLGSRRSSVGLNGGSDIKLFELDHKAGRKDGNDIVFSTLLFLIETSTKSIDLIFGYFQLFSELDATITRAIERGVKVRLISNSKDTNGLAGYNLIFREAFIRLQQLGAEIYVTGDLDQFDDQGKFCLHYKLAIVDSQAAMVGSWNCIGTSVFFDSDFSLVMFDADGTGGMFQPFEQLIQDSIDLGRVVPMTEPPEGYEVPLHYWVLGNNSLMTRGF